MFKKTVLILVAILSIFTIVACTKDNDLKLPDLSGKTKQEVVAIFSNLGILGEFDDVANIDIPEGRFVSYGQGFAVDQVVKAGDKIAVNFAYFANVLPDLTGKTQAQIYSSLARINVIVEIQLVKVSGAEPGYFVEYDNQLKAGDIVNDDTVVVANVAAEIGLIISKYFEGSDESKMIELYNSTNKAIDLTNFKLIIYRKATASTTEIEIQLAGSIASQGTFIIANPNSRAEVLALADMTSANLSFNGREAIALIYNNSVDIDVLGTIGGGILYANDRTLVRDISVTEGNTTFNISKWGTYVLDNFSMFGSHPVAYPTEFLLGTQYLTLDYFTEKGGVVKVNFVSNNDGDTAQFTPGFMNNDRVRFVGIDTTETGSGTLATQAKNYVNSLLENATDVYIQNDPTTGIRETYGRHLGLVWADGVLVNYMVVKMGYSQNNYADDQQRLVFNGISLDQWFKNAESYAKENKLGMWA